MKIMLLSNMDYSGAGNAATKIFEMLKKNKVDCDLIVNKQKTELSSKFKLSIKENCNDKLRNFAYYFFNYIININKFGNYKSLGLFDSFYPDKINKTNHDIVQLHWINGFLSINDINKINKPIIWRFSDFWPCSGIYHYENFENAKEPYFLKIINNLIKNYKINLWKKRIKIITPSIWMKTLVERSYTFKNFEINVINTPINKNTFKKNKSKKLKSKYGIDDKKNIILFGAENLDDPRKGFTDIIELFEKQYLDKNDYQIITFGNYKVLKNKIKKLNIKNFGYLESKEKLNDIYNCADLMIITSRMDNLPQVGLEAQMSGLPLVVYNNSGLSELVEDKHTGFIAENNSISSLANCIKLFFSNSQIQNNFSLNSIKRAEENFSEEVVLNKYCKIYGEILRK